MISLLHFNIFLFDQVFHTISAELTELPKKEIFTQKIVL